MLKIRFRRVGRKKVPLFRLVVTQASKSVTTPPIEVLGAYNPKAKESKLTNVKKERLDYWRKNGAQVSPSAARLLAKQNLL
ncbi:30S ribosomal protein S16 [Elusimicrobiota bacterium]